MIWNYCCIIIPPQKCRKYMSHGWAFFSGITMQQKLIATCCLVLALANSWLWMAHLYICLICQYLSLEDLDPWEERVNNHCSHILWEVVRIQWGSLHFTVPGYPADLLVNMIITLRKMLMARVTKGEWIDSRRCSCCLKSLLRKLANLVSQTFCSETTYFQVLIIFFQFTYICKKNSRI